MIRQPRGLGRLPQPSPGSIFVDNPKVWLEDVAGNAVYVTERGVFSSQPGRLKWGSKEWAVQGWAGALAGGRAMVGRSLGRARAARAQVLLEESRALLMICEGGGWSVEGVYE